MAVGSKCSYSWGHSPHAAAQRLLNTSIASDPSAEVVVYEVPADVATPDAMRDYKNFPQALHTSIGEMMRANELAKQPPFPTGDTNDDQD